uniref:Uncharacterized protein n=1 Tax=Avena sativa TaxID=4498 RepID=A0ACD5YZV6_AVESA
MPLRGPSRFMVLTPISFHRPTPMDPQVAGGTTRRSRRPDWVLLHKSARISGHRNTTTAGCHTMEGQPIEVSFWLVDPPGVSYSSVHCPGLNNKELADEPHMLCAEAGLVLFSVSFVPVPRRISTQHFVYRAGPGNPSLHLIPDPDKIRRAQLFGLVPFGDNGHYAVVFLDKDYIIGDKAWRFEVHAFSSVTRSWSSKVPLSGLSEDDQKLLLKHGTCKPTMVGATSLGWVDLFRGILLICDVFGDCPVIKYIPLPASRFCQMDKHGHPYFAAEYCCDVSCCDDLIKFAEIKFDDPRHRTTGNQGWKVTTWDRRITSNNWRQCFTVDVANISVDPSYSDLLPGLWNDRTGELELKKLIFYTLTLSKHDDNFLYVMCKVNSEDDKAWVITIDMEQAAVEAIAPYSTRGRLHVAWHCPCTFPKYLDLNPGDDVNMHSERISLADFVLQVLLTQDWFRELDASLEFGSPTYNECLSLLHCCPVSSLLLDIQEVVKHAFNASRGGAAPKAVDFCSRALEDFDMLLHKLVDDPSTSTEAMRSKISVALLALDSILNIVPPSARVLADACHHKRDKATFELHEKPGQTEDYKSQDYLDANLSHRKKPAHTSNDSRGKKHAPGRKATRVVGPGRPSKQSRSPLYLLILVCLLSATFILTLIIMKSLGHHPSMQNQSSPHRPSWHLLYYVQSFLQPFFSPGSDSFD